MKQAFVPKNQIRNGYSYEDTKWHELNSILVKKYCIHEQNCFLFSMLYLNSKSLAEIDQRTKSLKNVSSFLSEWDIVQIVGGGW